jgi:hypothetical protein
VDTGMTVILPFFGYIERQQGGRPEVRDNPNSAVNARRIKAVSDFCKLIRIGLYAGHALRFADSADVYGDQISRRGNTFNELHKSYCFFETDIDNRPKMNDLLNRCSEIFDGNRIYKRGAIVITKIEDIFTEAYYDNSFNALRLFVELNIPVFAVQEGDFEDIINQIRREPKNRLLYDEIVDLSLDYRKKMKNLLNSRCRDRDSL